MGGYPGAEINVYASATTPQPSVKINRGGQECPPHGTRPAQQPIHVHLTFSLHLSGEMCVIVSSLRRMGASAACVMYVLFRRRERRYYSPADPKF